MEQGADAEINRLKETLAATSHEMQQFKEDFADRADQFTRTWFGIAGLVYVIS